MSDDDGTCEGYGPLDEAGGLRRCAACGIFFRPEGDELLCPLDNAKIDRDTEERLEREHFDGWFDA
jgi:hypothetical protein